MAATNVTIGTAIIAPHPERFGVNIDIRDYEPWNPNALLFNNWLGDGGMEPIILRYKGTATGGGATTVENAAGPTTADETITDGFFDGADVRIYRIVDDRVQLLRSAKVAHYRASATAGYALILDGPGPSVQPGDTYFLSLIRDDAPTDKVHPRLAALATADTWQVHLGLEDSTATTARRDARTVAPAYGSRTSLRIEIGTMQEGGVRQYIAGASKQNVFNAFDPRRTYRVELWLRHEGVRDAAVDVRVSPFRETIRHTFTVTGDWARYRFTFKGPRQLAGTGLAHLGITFRGPGTLWVDDVRLFDTRWPAYALRPELVRRLADFRPGVLRIWSGQTNTAWGTTLDNWLVPEGQGMRFWEPERGPVPGALLSLPTALALARTTGATPWLIVHPSFDEAEWRGLVEYLAGLPDSPYGTLRAAAGQVRPWSEEFARIYIEYGNETWNPLFRPWNFENGTLCGRFAEYFFGEAKASPSYPAAEATIVFVLSGRKLSPPPRTYAMSAREASPSTSLICFAEYLAGWERSRIRARTHEEQFRNTLIYAPWVTHYLIDRQVALHSLHAKLGFPSILGISELGSHYPLPRPGTPVDQDVELVGKSLATAVGLLDALLYNSAQGLGPQAYYAWGVGARWTSHTGWESGTRPHPTWLALQMRNRYAEGAMVSATVTGGEAVDVPEIADARIPLPALPNPQRDATYIVPPRSGIPLLAAYAFRHGGRYAIFVLSRELLRSTPVTLHLPTIPAAATRYTLTGDPRATNLDALRIAIRRRRIRQFGQHYTFAMPPGSIYLFVVDST